MCGIAGILNLDSSEAPPDLDALAQMAAALSHRGPDDFGIYRDSRVGLSHARLSIIDLVTGQQPLTNETGTISIVFNGEIFNYIELRKELIAAGHRFRTRSDTEVIVHAYEEWGRAAFDRVQRAVGRGTLGRQKPVAGARERSVRRPAPLSRARTADACISRARSRRCLPAIPGIPRRLDLKGLDQLFTFWTTVAPQTIFDGVEELRPGSVRTYAQDGLRESSCVGAVIPLDGGRVPGVDR